MPKQTIYTVGGTVQAGGGIYIKRKADDELLELCRKGEFAFILSSRQVGKSSLMVRTAQQLEKENIRSVTIDLSAIGVNVTQDEWYLGILNEIHTTLNLETDIFAWWAQFAQLGPAQRLNNFFRDVLLKEVNEQIVLFFDEIDSTLSIPFSDDFYVALRSVYNARSISPDLKRLSFVLVGVAAPSDLISDNKRTPFNIGHRVEINDFTLAEALPLAEGLGESAIQVLTWIFQYTGGHPYLTQRLCAYLASSMGAIINEQVVSDAVKRLFTGEQGKQDNNLQFVRDMLSKRSPDVAKVLLIYRDIRSGKNVEDDERSIAKAHLKLSGLVRSEKGILRVRNEIYNTAFNLHWVQDNIPKNWQKAALISLSAILGLLILGTLAILINDYFVSSRIDKHFRSFISAGTPRDRLANLAEIYRQKGVLSNKDSDLTASQLFYGLSTAEDQLALFKPYGFPPNPEEQRVMQDDLIIVISHLYITVANVDPEEDNTELLQAMLIALDNIPDDATANRIREGIAAWIEARKSTTSGDYEKALENYNSALSGDPGNHAILYERAKVYVALGQYQNALSDLDATIGAARQALPDVGTPTPTVNSVSESATADGTSIPTNEPTISSTPKTSVPIESDKITLETLTPSSTPTPLPFYTSPPKYESNFTTLIEIINAVQAVIKNNLQLQVAMQTSTDGTYTNLQSSGLISFTQVATTGLLADIIRRGYIMVASDSNYEPQSFLNSEGVRPADTKCPTDALTTSEMQGFDVDVAIEVGNALGVETCFATPDWDVITAGIWADKWDLSIGSMTITTARQQVFDFSIPYYYFPAVIAVRSDSEVTSPADLEGKSLCVGAATTYEAWLTHSDLGLPASSIYSEAPNVTVVPLDTDLECVQALVAGREDFVGYVTSDTVVAVNIAAGFPVRQLGSPVFSEDIAAAFDKSSSLPTDSLRAEVDQIFTAMHADGRLSALSNKWFSEDLTQDPKLVNIPPAQTPSGDITQSGTPEPSNTPLPSLPTFAIVTLPGTQLASPTPLSVFYTVQVGDTLSSIALRFGTTIEAVTQANNMGDSTSIFIGQVLRIPLPTLTATPTPPLVIIQ